MGTTALSIKGKTSGGDGITSTINYVNPSATATQLQSLATAFNDLTTNTIVDVTRIDKNSLTGISPKQSRNLQWKTATSSDPTNATVPLSSIGTDIDNSYVLYMTSKVATNEAPIIENNSPLFMSIANDETGSGATQAFTIEVVKYNDETWTGEIKFTLPETDIYEAAEITLTIT